MPESGEQGNSKGTSGKHLGVEETAAFLLSTLWVLVWCHGRAQSLVTKKWTATDLGGRRTDGNIAKVRGETDMTHRDRSPRPDPLP